MLKLTIPSRELYDEVEQCFIPQEEFTLELEHSLVSLSKWESFTLKPFLTNEGKTEKELEKYMEFMILSANYPEDWYRRLSEEQLLQISEYIESPQTATTFGEMPKKTGRNEIITSELIYYWLVTFQISFEVENWHLNRLFALVRICNVKQQKPTPKSKTEVARHYRELNEKRRAQANSKG